MAQQYLVFGGQHCWTVADYQHPAIRAIAIGKTCPETANSSLGISLKIEDMTLQKIEDMTITTYHTNDENRVNPVSRRTLRMIIEDTIKASVNNTKGKLNKPWVALQTTPKTKRKVKQQSK